MEENTLIRLEALQVVLGEYAEEVARYYKENLDRDDRYASGKLVQSVESRIAVNGQAYQVQLRLEDYWKYVEWDTRPHWPPTSALLQWIEVKPVIPQPGRNGKLPTPQQLAYLIGRKIARFGTKGSHTLAKTLEEINDRYEERIREALTKDLGDAVHGWIIEYLVRQ